jgi:hypothetical protein
MKKFIVFLIILFAISAAGFSQVSGWRFNGFLYSNLLYDIDQKTWGGADAMVDGATMNFLYYTQLGGEYERGNMGMSIALRAISGYDTSESLRSPLPSIGQAYGWGRFFDRKLELKVGLVKDSTYNSGGKISTDGGEGAGIMLKYTPITGLSVGGGVYAPRLPTKTETDRASHLTVTVPAGGGEIEIPLYPVTRTPGFSTSGVGPVEKGTFSWGVVYELSKVFKVSNAGSWRDNTFPLITTGAHLLKIPNFTFTVELFTSNIQYKLPDAGYPFIALDESVTYRKDKLAAGISAYQFFNNTNILLSRGGPGTAFYSMTMDVISTSSGMDVHYVNEYDVGFAFDPYVSYQIGSFTPRLDMTFEKYGNRNTTTATFMGATMYDTTVETQRFIFSMKPRIGVRVGMGASLDLAYSMQMVMDTVNGDKVDPVFDNKMSVMFILMF